MNYEKAYKEILEKIQTLIDKCKKQRHIIIRLEDIENIFPEFRESEEERIRKWLIDTIKAVPNDSIEWEKIDKSDVLAWLEKQGEQKSAEFKPSFRVGDVIKPKDPVLGEPRIIKGIHPKFGYDTNNGILDFEFEDNWELVEQKSAEKSEPKFKVGDWVMLDRPVLITKVEDMPYNTHRYWTSDGTWFGDATKAKLWTIEDAKDGDVLATLDYILIFKEFLKNDGGISYCHYDFGAGNPQFIWFEDKNWYFGKEAIVYPATKEQRNLLFQKMKEDGYEWDAEKKKLKKIEQKSADKVEPKFKVGDKIRYLKGRGTIMTIEKIENGEYIFGNNLGHTTIESGNKWHLVEQTPAWSKEDENMLDTIIDASEHHCMLDLNDIDWLKSLKYKVQPKQEWSEEDETNILYILAALDCYYRLRKERNNTNGQENLDKARNWLYNKLKSLKSQRN